MACFRPNQAYYANGHTKNFRRVITFDPKLANSESFPLPCGNCSGCRLERGRQWALRCMHEAQMHDRNCFITLTYSSDYLPYGGTLVKKDFQDFMKRFRDRFGERTRIFDNGISRYKYLKKFRYFHCGEYGEELGRPHYHALIFGYDFDDRVFLKRTPSGSIIYSSDQLSELWPMGYSSVGDLTFKSAAYVARYVLKKVNGFDSEDHYCGRLPEYTTMSRRPGIGKFWYEKFMRDIYPHDFLYVGDRRVRTTKFYDKLYSAFDPESFEDIQEKRRISSVASSYSMLEEFGSENVIQDRLYTLEKCKEYDLLKLPRVLDKELFDG